MKGPAEGRALSKREIEGDESRKSRDGERGTEWGRRRIT